MCAASESMFGQLCWAPSIVLVLKNVAEAPFNDTVVFGVYTIELGSLICTQATAGPIALQLCLVGHSNTNFVLKMTCRVPLLSIQCEYYDR